MLCPHSEGHRAIFDARLGHVKPDVGLGCPHLRSGGFLPRRLHAPAHWLSAVRESAEHYIGLETLSPQLGRRQRDKNVLKSSI